MKGYAVLYERIFPKKGENIWFLKPKKIVQVSYNSKRKEYKYKDKIVSSIDSTRILDGKSKYYIGSIMGEGTPMYSKEKCEALMNDRTPYVLTGTFDFEDKVTLYKSIKLDYKDDELIYKFSCPEKTIEDMSESLIRYISLVEKSGQEMTVLTDNEISTLLSINNYEDYKRLIKYLVESKENYYFKSKNEEKICMILDEYLEASIENNTLEEAKEEIKDSLDFIGYNNDEEEKKIEESEVSDEEQALINEIKLNDEVFNNLLQLDDLDTVREFLDAYRQSFILDEKEREEIENTNPHSLVYYDLMAKKIEEIKNLDNLDDVKKLLVGLYKINDEMLKEGLEKFKKEKEEEVKKVYTFDYNEVRKKLVSEIIGRDIQISAILNTIERNDRINNPSKRASMLIAGPTGSGKTMVYYKLKNALDAIRPVVIVDTNQLTQAGFIGGTIDDNILKPLLIEARNINIKNGKITEQEGILCPENLLLAQHGIVILDEIDKRSKTIDDGSGVNTTGVINELLTLMDPCTEFPVRINVGNGGMATFMFNTSHLTIFAGGAFQDYFDELDSNKNYGFVGKQEDKDDRFKRFKEVNPEVLVKHGLDRQFVGRCRVALFEKHTKDTLKDMELNKSVSNLQTEIDYYKSYDIDFVWSKEYFDALIDEAYKLNLGGRGLKNIVMRSLGTLQNEVSIYKEEIKTIYVPKEALKDSGNIMIIKRDNNVILLSELERKTQEENRLLKQKNSITLNLEALNEAEMIYHEKVLRK